MKFERLRLTGFKTFVEAADLTIAPGLTGIVGPNGCGKSNLVEALRWVMGETSSRALRGGGMEDVIFSGSDTRPARMHAEVSVRVSALPGDLPASVQGAEEVEVSRKITREQGSTYRMNGREVRARDVHLLFADAASGARSPALVRQGQISEIIAAKPQHRRRILEDAAGIGGLQTRRHEAEIRLNQASENLIRAEDLLGQLDKQVSELRKQAKNAEKFRIVQAQLRQLALLAAAERYQSAKTEAEAAANARQAAIRAVALATAAQGEAERARGGAVLTREKAQGALSEGTQRLQSHQTARAVLEGEIKLVETRLAELARRRQEIFDDSEKARHLTQEAERICARTESEAKTTRAAREQTAQAIEQAQLALAQAEQARQEAETRHMHAQTTRAEAQARESAAKAHLAEAKTRAQRLATQLEEAKAVLARLAPSAHHQDALARQSAQIEADEAAFSALQTEAERAATLARSAEQTERAARETLSEADRLYQRLATEARTIRALVEQSEPGLWTPMIDLITVEPGYETALAAALGEDLEAAIEHGAARFWDERGGTREPLPVLPGEAQPLLGFLRAPERLHPRLSQIGVVTRAQGHALQAHLAVGQRLVTQEGDVWRWDGFTGRAESQSPAAKRLAERNRLGGIEQEATRAQARYAARLEEHKQHLAALQGAQGAEHQARTQAQQANRALAQARHQHDALRKAQEAAHSKSLESQMRVESLTTAWQEAEHNLKQAQQALEALSGLSASQGQAAATALADQVAEIRTREARLRGQVSAHQAQLAVLEERLGALDRSRKSALRRAEDAETNALEQQSRLGKLDREAENLHDKPDMLQAQLATLSQELEQMEAENRAAGDSLASAEHSAREAEANARIALNALSETRADLARLESEADHAALRQREVREALENVLEAPASTLAQRLADLPADLPREAHAISVRIGVLQAERERIGAVNLLAEQELQAAEGARGKLGDEREDLLAAIAGLREAINTLNTEGRARLKAAFLQVNAHFTTLFTRLFGGGIAELSLIEADDPIEAGLEITAAPPGKRAQLLTLLSGGEQALTATALIFAVFLSNPAPICVLDEVDAPLDDANVERLCDLLHDMAQQTETRFLCITHNPISMARMDRLYGVTMAERGISQLVSVDLATAASLVDNAA